MKYAVLIHSKFDSFLNHAYDLFVDHIYLNFCITLHTILRVISNKYTIDHCATELNIYIQNENDET